MRYKFDAERFASCVRQYAQGRNFREVANEGGLTHTVVWRIAAQGSTPSMDTFAQLCGMMRVEPREFFYDATDGEE